jgi:Poxvirus Late Transcription Factor VLTF3 like
MSHVSLDQLLCKEEIPAQTKVAKVTESVKTLESLHSQQLSTFAEEKTNLPELRAKLKAMKQELAIAERDYTSPHILAQVNDIQTLMRHSRLETQIQELETKIAGLESGSTVADYFLRVGNILFSYTDAQERIAAGEAPYDPSPTKKSRVPSNSVCAYFTTTPEVDSVNKLTVQEVKTAKTATNLDNTLGFKRDKALETYMHALDPDGTGTDVAIANSMAEDFGNCPICDTEMYFNDTFLDCPQCGHRDMILVDSEKPSYKDPPREMSYYAYKKINHLNEWLAQFQAKETTEISVAVLDQIKAELRKERITDMSKVKPSKLKEVIKKLKLHRCYDHVAHILNRLNGVSAPVLSREVEEKLRFMFKEIQFSFVKHCPKKRSNFLSYSFVLYKFCELLELDEYLPCFPLLKSREKLYMQDKIWQKICEDMSWEFIRTV